MNEENKPKTGDSWGPWTYHKETETLTYNFTSRDAYEIPIDEIKNLPTSELPDWLAQLADKSWMDESKMGHFVYALHSIIGLRTLIR